MEFYWGSHEGLLVGLELDELLGDLVDSLHEDELLGDLVDSLHGKRPSFLAGGDSCKELSSPFSW